VPGVREFLERLRPSATPGAPSASGVPADRPKERSSELEGAFASLAGVQAEVERIRTEATAEARARRESGAERARAIIDEARRNAEAERASAAASVRADAQSMVERILVDGRRDAAEILDRARARLPELAESVAGEARVELSTPRSGPT